MTVTLHVWGELCFGGEDVQRWLTAMISETYQKLRDEVRHGASTVDLYFHVPGYDDQDIQGSIWSAAVGLPVVNPAYDRDSHESVKRTVRSGDGCECRLEVSRCAEDDHNKMRLFMAFEESEEEEEEE